MAGNLIASTPKAEMHPLAFQGIQAYTCFSQIRDMLLRKFGDEYVLLFAKPVENEKEGLIDWYSPVQGEAKPLADLPQTGRDEIYAKINKMADEIAGFADELIKTQDPLKETRGSILKLALCFPDDKALYIVGQQPVYTCWGFAPGTRGAEGRNLTRLIQPSNSNANKKDGSGQLSISGNAGSNAMPDNSKSQKNSCGKFGLAWLWWLLPLFALFLLFLLFFSSFGSLAPLSGKAFFHFPAIFNENDGDAYKAEIASMKQKIADAQTRLKNHAELCKPQKLQEKPQPKAAIPENGLMIPKNAENLSFMQGLWLCETGLASKATGEPIKVTFEFDKNGQGITTVYEKNMECKGRAKAQINKGKLYIIAEEQTCPNGQNYSKILIDCENSENSVSVCKGTNPDKTQWEAAFYKIRKN